MDRRDMQPSDLVRIFGFTKAVEDVLLTGKADLDRSSADLLGQLFHVDALLFVR
jgi:hypothetical protein